MKRHVRFQVLAGLPCLLLLAAGFAFGQGVSGEIFGTITDPSGAAIPGAEVVVRNTATNDQRRASTDEQGKYEFTALLPGPYSVHVTKSGFKVGDVSEVQLLVKQEREVDLTLQIGQGIAMVRVTAASVALDTQDAAQGQVLTSGPVATLPLNGQNFVALVGISPGAQPVTGSVTLASGAMEVSGRTNSSVSVGGNREQNMTYTFDGVESKSYWVGANGFLPPPDAIAEFSVQRGYLSAEFGQPAVVNVITKSGQDTLHGSAYDFFRNSDLDARNFFDGVRPTYRWNQFGASAGGRFPHTQKHHWFGYYEGLRKTQGTTNFAILPSANELQGNFSDLVPSQNGGGCPYDPQNLTGNCLPTTTSQIIDPLTGKGFTTPNVIPASRINSLAKGMIPLWTLPNAPMTGTGNFVAPINAFQRDDQFSVRTDHSLTNRDSVFGRFSYANSNLGSPGVFKLTGNGIPFNVRNVAVGWTHTLRPDLVNSLRVGYSHVELVEPLPIAPGNPSSFGFKNEADPTGLGCAALPTIGILNDAGFPTDASCGGGLDRDLSFFDGLTWVKSKHTITFGADIRRVSHRVFDQDYNNGSIGYSEDFSGNGFADFMLGAPSSGNFSVGIEGGTHNGWWMSYYINDLYRLTNKLTVSLGLRYMNNSQLPDTEHNESMFDRATASLVYPGQNGIPSAIANRANTDVAPRVGFAYKVTSHTVIRSAYGVYFVDDPTDELAVESGNPPFSGTLSQSAVTPGVLTYTLNQGLATDLLPTVSVSIPPTGAPGGTLSIGSREQDRHSPYVQSWNFTIQHTLPWNMLLDVAYVGNESNHLSKRVDWNTAYPLTGPPCGSTPVAGCDPRSIDQRRPFPNFGAIFSDTNMGTANYNSLEGKLEKATSHGLYFNAGYTYGKAMSEDDYESIGERNYSWLDIRGDYARATFDKRHRFVLAMTYDLPFGRGASTWIGRQASGWEFASILSFTTGAPAPIKTGPDYAQIGELYGFSRADRICNGNLPANQRTPNHWFNGSCFVAPISPFPHLGNSGWDILNGPGFEQNDISVLKDFKLSERLKLQFRAEFFNMPNIPNFSFSSGAPLNLTSGIYDRINAALDPREIQFALKMTW